MKVSWLVLLLMSLIPRLVAQQVILQAPLTTVVPIIGEVQAGPCVLHATIITPQVLPSGAQSIGVGGFVADRHGRWFQCLWPAPLTPGSNTIALRIDANSLLRGEPHRAAWNTTAEAQIAQAGIFFWSTQELALPLEIVELRQETLTVTNQPARQLLNLTYQQQDTHGLIQLTTGARWSLTVTPTPFPVNPYDPSEFQLDAIFTSPTGEEIRIPGFAMEPIDLIDRGDKQIGQPSGPCHFSVRWRPGQPGTWKGRLEAQWNEEEPIVVHMPPIQVSGPLWDDYVRNDKTDVRFFRIGEEWFWPIGVNLHSTFDQRSQQRLGTVLTPERGSEAYAARFKRLAAAGCNATEIWMASWNLALEWNAAWPGYGGTGRYNQFHAAKMDRVLDDAHANGIRINLVINNHGQASPSNDREWKDNPWNKENGGPFTEPYQLFYEEQAFIGQAQLRLAGVMQNRTACRRSANSRRSPTAPQQHRSLR
jgi:hypothetical protein